MRPIIGSLPLVFYLPDDNDTFIVERNRCTVQLSVRQLSLEILQRFYGSFLRDRLTVRSVDR